MIVDEFNGVHSTCSRQAAKAYEGAVRGFAAHRPFLTDLDQALAHDPQMPAAHALRGFAFAMSGREAGMTDARRQVRVVRRQLHASGGGSSHERVLAAAHAEAADGHFGAAASLLEAHVARAPTDLVAFKLAHAVRFMTGDAKAMEQASRMALPHWSAGMPGYGFVLGCRAFALEEMGRMSEAEEIGRRAIAVEPDDAWGLHAIAHVMETSGRTREGRLLLEPARAAFRACGPFAKHLLWHLALFHLAEGNGEGALALLDDGMMPALDGDFRDMANAVSLLWRLEQDGLDVGGRWESLHEIAHRRRQDCTYAFASLHYLMALIGARDFAAAQELIAAMRTRALTGADDQAQVMSQMAVRLAEVLIGGVRGDAYWSNLDQLALQLYRLGGSNAQRDVFLRTLMLSATAAHDTAACEVLCVMRRQQRQEDRFQELLRRRLRGMRRAEAILIDCAA